VVARLLKAGGNPNRAHKDGRTPLSIARKSGHAATVELLMAGSAV